MKSILSALFIAASLMACQHNSAKRNDQAPEQSFELPFTQFTLDNGLQVIMHVDRSDPVVAVALTAHVGSAREKAGRTGFAHLFEHLLFLESENLGKGGLDAMSARIGGSGANGSTSRDRTNYFQTVPSDALEKMLWAEADKLGFFINTVTEPVLAKEKQVVKNEKRQGIDNQPYGHTQLVIGNNLYQPDHPYHWQVIGSLEDLQQATLDDVKEFFNRWYVPNNVTLVIAGDFDVAQAKAWVHHYFDEIKRGPEVLPLDKRPAGLSSSKSLYYEDNFATVPELTYVWPTVPNYHPDSYALNVLANFLSEGKTAPLNQVLVDQLKLTANVSTYQFGSELAGEFGLVVRAFDGVDLDQVAKGVDTALANFASKGISLQDLNRIKAGQETAFYNGIESVLGKAFQLAQYNIFAGDPAYINEDIKHIQNVTVSDVMYVYRKYLGNRHRVQTSFVPQGQPQLALKDAQLAAVKEEVVVAGQEDSFDPSMTASYEPTPSKIDRSIEPPYGPAPELKIPVIWQSHLTSGLKVLGTENGEVPLVQISARIKGGQLNESLDLLGTSNLLSELLQKGTRSKTTAELEYAINDLGANISIDADQDSIYISATSLAKNYPAVMELITEMLLEPRWDEGEFELIKEETINLIRQQQSSPVAIANQQFNQLIYGTNHVFAHNLLGSEQTVEKITMQHMQDYYHKHLAPKLTSFRVVGAVDQATVERSLQPLNEQWSNTAVAPKTWPQFQTVETPSIYFYDIPDAKQSQLRIGYPALAFTDDDFYPANIMNYRLGGGGFASQLTQQLRETKGYTYQVFSAFNGTDVAGPFQIGSGVRTNVTTEAVALILNILKDYGKNYSAEDLAVSQSFLLKSNARRFETLGAKLNMISTMDRYDLDADYIQQRRQQVEQISVAEIKRLATEYLNQERLVIFIAGDAKTQLPGLKALGLGEVVLLNP